MGQRETNEVVHVNDGGLPDNIYLMIMVRLTGPRKIRATIPVNTVDEAKGPARSAAYFHTRIAFCDVMDGKCMNMSRQ